LASSEEAVVHAEIQRAKWRPPISNTDWLKTMAIIATTIDHLGFYFIDHDVWMEILGRLAAPTFFFLIGYARTRAVPLHWVAMGLILSGLESWNAGWHWAVPNIFLNFVLIRLALHHLEKAARRYPTAVGAVLPAAFFVALPFAGELVDYGAEGWAWALFGLYQRFHVEGRSEAGRQPTTDPGPIRLLTCAAAAAIFVWAEQLEYGFGPKAMTAFAVAIALLSLHLLRFRRAASVIQPPEPLAGVLRFIGHHTLEIYAVQMICFEMAVKLIPGWAA
jgi:hypothetical protein